MLEQKQRHRVRISSNEKVINMVEMYIPSESTCSCEQCDSIDCFDIRNINSGISCTCMDCDPNKCFTWESNKYQYKPNNETSTVFPKKPKYIQNVPETTIKSRTSKELLVNTTNNTKKKESCTYLSNHPLDNTCDDHEPKEVLAKEAKLIGSRRTLKILTENKNIDGFKDTTSNKKTDIIERNVKRNKKKLKNQYDPEIMHAFAKDPEIMHAFTKTSCHKKITVEKKKYREVETQKNVIKFKKVSSKIYVPLPQNESAYSGPKEILKRNNFPNNTQHTYNEVSPFGDKINIKEQNNSYEKDVSRLQNVAINHARSEFANLRGELSAQIMDVPCEEFKDSFSRKKSPIYSSTSNSSTKFKKNDIFTRIKEIYNACSCKVCECIADKSLLNRSDVGKCVPCDCYYCNNYNAKFKKVINHAPHSGCPCVTCDRKDCRGIVKSKSNYTDCDCKPRDYVRCSKSCTKPCSYTDCQSEKNIKNYSNKFFNYTNKSCKCDVCECIACKDKKNGSVINKSVKIEKSNYNLDNNYLKYCEYSRTRTDQSCKSLVPENIAGTFRVETGYDASSTTTNIKYIGYNYKIMCNNENFKKAQLAYSAFENECNSECKNVVDVASQNFTNTTDGFIHDSSKCYLLKRGTILIPSMFGNNELTQNCFEVHVKSEKDSLRVNECWKKNISNDQDTKLCRNKSQHNYFDNDAKENIINEFESDVKMKFTNSSKLNMLSKEGGTKEIYKINSVDFKKSNVSKVFLHNNDSKAKLQDKDLMHVTSKPSTQYNKKLEYNKTMNKCSPSTLLHRQEVEDLFYKTMSSSDNDIHFSSVESMSLVKMLCEERNINIDKNDSRKILQSLEKIPPKRSKMVEENVSHFRKMFYTSDKSLNERGNGSFSTNNNLLKNIDQEQIDTLYWSNLTDKKMNNYNIHGQNIFRVRIPETTRQIRPKEDSNYQVVEKKPNNYNMRAKLIKNKPRSKAKTVNTNLKIKRANHSKDNVNKFNNKRYLEIPDVINTAASAINFTEIDKCIDFEKCFKLLRELNVDYDENKKAKPTLRKNFFTDQGNVENKGMCSIPLLDIKNAIKSTNTISPYCPGNKLNTKVKCYMANAISQTKRSIVVDKEIYCNMFESRDNLRQSIQNLINMTLTDVMQCRDFETKKQNLIRYFNKAPSLNVDGRPVKKIVNPSRCMAVLTCLPHCEKLLLTIRTLTDLETSLDPVTTIVYYPNKNKSGPY